MRAARARSSGATLARGRNRSARVRFGRDRTRPNAGPASRRRGDRLAAGHPLRPAFRAALRRLPPRRMICTRPLSWSPGADRRRLVSPPGCVSRLDHAAAEYARHASASAPAYVLLSGSATPHKPPPLAQGGFPFHESTAMAEYLIDRGVPPEKILKDTASMDTIGNAYFSLVQHAAPRGWTKRGGRHRRLPHGRTRAPSSGSGTSGGPPALPVIAMDFAATPDDGLSPEVCAGQSRARGQERGGAARERSASVTDLPAFAERLYTTHSATPSRGARNRRVCGDEVGPGAQVVLKNVRRVGLLGASKKMSIIARRRIERRRVIRRVLPSPLPRALFVRKCTSHHVASMRIPPFVMPGAVHEPIEDDVEVHALGRASVHAPESPATTWSLVKPMLAKSSTTFSMLTFTLWFCNDAGARAPEPTARVPCERPGAIPGSRRLQGPCIARHAPPRGGGAT